MKSLAEAQVSAWDIFKGAMKASGADVQESWRAAVNLAVIDVYNACRPIEKPVHPMDLWLKKAKVRIRRGIGPVLLAGGAWLGYRVGRGDDLSALINVIGLVVAAVGIWYLIEWAQKGAKS